MGLQLFHPAVGVDFEKEIGHLLTVPVLLNSGVAAVERNLVDRLFQRYYIDVGDMDFAADMGSNYTFEVGIDMDMATDYEETAIHLIIWVCSHLSFGWSGF